MRTIEVVTCEMESFEYIRLNGFLEDREDRATIHTIIDELVNKAFNAGREYELARRQNDNRV